MPGSTLRPDDFRTLRTAWSIARVRRDVASIRKTPGSKRVPIAALVREQWERARTSPRGQSSSIVATDPSRQFRQTVLAVTEGHRIAEHHDFQMTTVHVLVGQVRVASGTTVSTATCGDLLVMPRTPHSLTAVRDSVVLLTSIGVARSHPDDDSVLDRAPVGIRLLEPHVIKSCPPVGRRIGRTPCAWHEPCG